MTAAAALPAAYAGRAAAYCNPIPHGAPIESLAGSSVSPLGRVPRNVAPNPRSFDPWGATRPPGAYPRPLIDPCGGGGAPALTPEQWWLAFYNAYAIYGGARPLPYGTVEVSGPDDPTAVAMRDPRGYMDHTDIAATLGILTVTTGAIGNVLGGPRGAAAGVVWGIAATVVIVVIDSTAVYLNHRQRALDSQLTATPSELFYLNNQLSAYVPHTGVYTIPSISGPGGGGHFVIPTYLLL